MEKLNFNIRTTCDWCNCEEVCAVTHYGTTHYNRLICVECAMSINQNDRIFRGDKVYFDLNNSTIEFPQKEETEEKEN